MPKGKNKKPVNKDRFISKMFLRYVPGCSLHAQSLTLCYCSGDSVILSKAVYAAACVT